MLNLRRRPTEPPTGGEPGPSTVTDHAESIRTLGVRAGELGRSAAELDGVLEDVAAAGNRQVADIGRLCVGMQAMADTSRAIDASGAAGHAALGQARVAVEQAGEGVRGVVNSLRSVADAATEITQIALQTRLVAFNATVEAKRAGEAGAGFAVVAEAVKDLASKVERSSKLIMQTVTQLDARIRDLAASLTDEAGAAHRGSFHEALGQVEAKVGEIRAATGRNLASCEEAVREVEAMAGGIAANADALRRVNTNTRQFLQASESMIELTNDCGAVTDDTPFIVAVQDGARRLGEALEDAVARGRIGLDELFDEQYVPIPGSDPQQFGTRFAALTDELFPEVQEALLAFDPRVVFCAAVDRNGYLPTHNEKFSRPQGADPVWNAANSRNRRLFNDRTGLSAGRNERRFLLQTYRRDMGGGQRVLMKDLSAPITVRGRHWGGLRLAYSF